MPTPNLTDKDIAVEFYNKRYEDGYMEEWNDDKKQKVKDIISLLNLTAKRKAFNFGFSNGIFTNIVKHALLLWNINGVEISKIDGANIVFL